MKSLNDLLSFSIYLQDDENKEIEFNSGERKLSILNFQVEVFLKWVEELDKTTQQIKEEQINFLLEDVEKNLVEYKKALELKDKLLSDIKKILQGAKKSYDSIIIENKELKNTLQTLNKGIRITNNSNKTNILKEKKIILKKNRQKNIKKFFMKKKAIVSLK